MNVAVMGYGTIGSGVVEILHENAKEIENRCGFPVKVAKVLDLRDFSNDPLIGDKLTTDYMDIVNDKDIDIVVETMGGVEPAFTFVKAMLEAGKHVTTSNKALVADKGDELMKIAEAKKVNFEFEAAVGGGIPIIRPLSENLSGDIVELIEGIINGTTNYILTRMKEEGLDFDTALKEAQDNGFAEKDPTADIDGFDATRKIAILTSIVARKRVDFNDIEAEGIRNITLEDIQYANAMNREIKLLARAQYSNGSYMIRTAPYLVSEKHPLSFVSGVFNAIFVRGNMLGDSMYYGSGAGKLPTASAVVGDVIDMARNSEKHLYTYWTSEKLELADTKDSVYSFFVRTKADEADVKSVFGEVEKVDAGISGECGYITKEMKQREFDEKKSSLSSIISVIRLA